MDKMRRCDKISSWSFPERYVKCPSVTINSMYYIDIRFNGTEKSEQCVRLVSLTQSAESTGSGQWTHAQIKKIPACPIIAIK